MTVTINFAPETYPETVLTIREILDRKHWSFPLIIAKLNGELVPREDYSKRTIAEGDSLELYHLVSGG